MGSRYPDRRSYQDRDNTSQHLNPARTKEETVSDTKRSRRDDRGRQNHINKENASRSKDKRSDEREKNDVRSRSQRRRVAPWTETAKQSHSPRREQKVCSASPDSRTNAEEKKCEESVESTTASSRQHRGREERVRHRDEEENDAGVKVQRTVTTVTEVDDLGEEIPRIPEAVAVASSNPVTPSVSSTCPPTNQEDKTPNVTEEDVVDKWAQTVSPNTLPILQDKAKILQSVMKHQVTILVAETGSGKTTQVPQFLVRRFYRMGKVACTQPRRVACTTVAKYVAQQFGTTVGDRVGYKVRFDDSTSANSKIIYLTDGMAVREALHNPNFDSYAFLIIDEAHERQINTDILFGLALKACEQREDFKLLIMSATLETQPLIEYFGENRTNVVNIKGRQHEVEVWHTSETQDDWMEAALLAVLQIHIDIAEDNGDILVFLPGQAEIEALQKLLEEKNKLMPGYRNLDLFICPLYAQLPLEKQMLIFEPAPPNTRKVVLSTNIAETSITIPNIKYVVDSGKVKMKVLNSANGVETLKTVNVSQAMARQRTGRAGREGPGACYRVFPAEEFENLSSEAPPEISRTDLAQTYLQLACMKLDPVNFRFLDDPSVKLKKLAMLYLKRINAIDGNRNITSIGKKLASLPIHPKLGKMLLHASEFECTSEILTLVSMLASEDTFYYTADDRTQKNKYPKQESLFDRKSDHITLILMYNCWKKLCKDNVSSFKADYGINIDSMRRAKKVRDQLKDLYNKHFEEDIKSCGQEHDKIRKCLATACRTHTARQNGPKGEYITDQERMQVKIHPHSLLHRMDSEMLVYNELTETKQCYLRLCTEIHSSWVPLARPVG